MQQPRIFSSQKIGDLQKINNRQPTCCNLLQNKSKPIRGIEPRTFPLQGECSATKLNRRRNLSSRIIDLLQERRQQKLHGNSTNTKQEASIEGYWTILVFILDNPSVTGGQY